VDCVAQAARTTPVARTTFGGRLRQGRPVVTLTIIAVCVVVWLAQRLPGVTERFEFVPALAGDEPWRFLTAAFLHSPTSILHILFNMYALWVTGPYLESILGRWRFAVLYVLCAIGGSVGSLLLAPPSGTGWVTPSVGASGAVFGLFGALVIVQRRMNQQFGQIIGLIAINGLLGFLVAGIAWQAHLGGLVTGLVLGLVMAHAPRRRRALAQVAGSAAVALVLVALSVARWTTALT
jgi:membrane associated rhomboid family serine protease